MTLREVARRSLRGRRGSDGRGEGGATPAGPPQPVAPLGAVERYDAERNVRDRAGICNAPSTNLYFSATGVVGPCWIQMNGEQRWSPEHSIRDIWESRFLRDLRSGLGSGSFPGACSRCGDDIERGVQPLAAIYDDEHEICDLPTSLELELSNLCNFECVMCNGNLSSKIRRNREHLPPLAVPYDGSFVEQVTELIPTLQRIRFSGGEPLLHPILYEICDRIIELRPDLRIVISTNGSTLNTKVRRLLERAQVQINISFESLDAAQYEAIRIGSDHEVLLANIEEFRVLTAVNGGFVTINANPMRATWAQMAAIVRYCDERDLYLSFNTVIQPGELSLRTLPADELEAVHRALEAEDFGPAETAVEVANREQFANLVEQVGGWARDAAAGGTLVKLGRRRRG